MSEGSLFVLMFLPLSNLLYPRASKSQRSLTRLTSKWACVLALEGTNFPLMVQRTAPCLGLIG